MKKKSESTESSGNVFADLGVEAPEEALAKAKLAAQLSRIISERKLTQVAAGQLLGIDQPKVSALMRGRLTAFSTERLIRYLNLLGRDVEIVVREAPKRRALGHLHVLAG